MLALATQRVNKTIRSQGLSAIEIHMAREQETGDNLILDAKILADEHIEAKEKNHKDS